MPWLLLALTIALLPFLNLSAIEQNLGRYLTWEGVAQAITAYSILFLLGAIAWQALTVAKHGTLRTATAVTATIAV